MNSTKGTTTNGDHPRHGLDDEFNSPVRFSIVAALAQGERVEFAFLRDVVQVSDSVLSKQTARLETAGVIKIHKGYVGKRPRTWLSITAQGASRYQQHTAALQAVIDTATNTQA